MRRLVFTLGMVCLFAHALYALELPNVLSSNMVFQQGKPVPIWGTAAAGTTVEVVFGDQVKRVVADASGSWMATLDAMKASFDARDLTIRSEDGDTVLSNILIGEVWLCGGQSNMEYPMRRQQKRYAAPARGQDVAELELERGGNPHIRLLRIHKKRSLPDCTTNGWAVMSDTALASFSAAGYYFGKYLQESLQVPVGLISSNWGGSRIEPWTAASAYRNSPVFAAEAQANPLTIDGSSVGENYNSMIAPLAPYALKGFIWYQGESNAMIHDARYVEKTALMLEDWRTIFNAPKAPFYFVQIAPYLYTRRSKDAKQHTPQTLPEFGALQTQCLELDYTGQVIVTDLVDRLTDIHPSYKWEVGRRLALQALAQTYGVKKEFSGPVLKSVRVKKNEVRLSFRHLGRGLTAGMHREADNAFIATNDTLRWFEVAGADAVFYPANAVVDGKKVVLSSPNVVEPMHVRFAWNERACPNFFNKEGLPAVPFQVSRR